MYGKEEQVITRRIGFQQFGLKYLNISLHQWKSGLQTTDQFPWWVWNTFYHFRKIKSWNVSRGLEQKWRGSVVLFTIFTLSWCFTDCWIQLLKPAVTRSLLHFKPKTMSFSRKFYLAVLFVSSTTPLWLKERKNDELNSIMPWGGEVLTVISKTFCALLSCENLFQIFLQISLPQKKF